MKFHEPWCWQRALKTCGILDARNAARPARRWLHRKALALGQRLGQRGDGTLPLLPRGERVAGKIYRTRDQARADVLDYIERFYNPRRRHSTIGYISPMEFEAKVKLA